MRLAIVRKRFNPHGGAERFIATAADGLARRGIDVTILTEAWEGGDAIYRTRLLPRGGITRSGSYRAFQTAVRTALASERFDLVQGHERIEGAHLFRAGDGVHAAWLDRLHRERPAWRKVLLRADPMHRLVVETERRMARSDMLFVANSGLIARELRDWLGVPERRLRIIENGIDLDHFRPPCADERVAARRALALPTDEPVVAFVGSGFARKGAFSLVDALALPACRGVRAVIAGRDRQAAQLQQRIEGQNLGGRVRLLGGVDDVRQVLAAADIFVLPSLYDPLPNAALEAIATGLPVVTTADTGVADALTESGAGVVATREREQLADGIMAALAQRETMRNAALGLRDRYDLDHATRRWLALYDELI